MATIKDVAKLAGVSIATVSNYLNQTKPVSKPVSAKIQEAIDTLQYSQNLSAKNLKSNTYMDVGLILPNFNDSYYVQIFQGIENSFQNTGYYVNLSFSYDIPEYEQNIVHNFLKKQICGLILVSCQPDNWKFYHDYFNSDERPLVLIDRDIHSLDANFVSFDNYSSIKNMTEELLNQNLKHIILMSGPEAFACEANCIRGFIDGFRAKGLKPEDNNMIHTALSKEDSFRKTIQLLKTRTPETIIATSESAATGIIEALTLLGYSTLDIPVVTLGEEHWNMHTHTLASGSASRPAIKLGQTASRLLLEQLHSPLTKENEKIILPSSDLNRSSVFSTPIRKPHRDETGGALGRSIRILMLDTPQVHTLQGLTKNFENLSGIKADITVMPHRYIYEEILSSQDKSDEETSDVVMYDIPWLPSLAASHVLYDITEELSQMDLSIFFKDCLKYYSEVNCHFYGLPFMYAPQIFYYRKDLFEEASLKFAYEKQNSITLRPPLTLKEFNTIADFFTNKTTAIPYGITLPAAYDECLAPEIYLRLRAYNASLFDASGAVSLDSAQALKAYINFIRSVKCAKPDYRTATDISAVHDFLNGQTAMLISYPAFLTDITDLRQCSITGSIGYHHIPGRSPLLGGWSLGITSRSRHKEEAMEFLKWTCDKQISNYLALLGGQSAITATYTNDELTKLYPWLPLYHSTYQYTKPTIPPNIPGMGIVPQHKIDGVVCKWIYELLEDKIEVQDAISRTHQGLQELLEAYKE